MRLCVCVKQNQQPEVIIRASPSRALTGRRSQFPAARGGMTSHTQRHYSNPGPTWWQRVRRKGGLRKNRGGATWKPEPAWSPDATPTRLTFHKQRSRRVPCNTIGQEKTPHLLKVRLAICASQPSRVAVTHSLSVCKVHSIQHHKKVAPARQPTSHRARMGLLRQLNSIPDRPDPPFLYTKCKAVST